MVARTRRFLAENGVESVSMDDRGILDQIRSLMDEEHDLRAEDTPVDAERLENIEVMLDQCWDLLRQRRARREYGEDPEAAHARDTGTVEGYQQ
jgi:hypothetical protein